MASTPVDKSQADSIFDKIPPLPQWLQNVQGWLWLIGAGIAIYVFWRSKGKSD